MKNNLYISIYLLIVAMISGACIEQMEEKEKLNPSAGIDTSLITEVMTAEKQAKLTPDLVIQALIDGNNRFVTGKMRNRDYREQVRQKAAGQYPKAVVLSCLDSRVPVEYVFDQGVGDIFVGRIAGNIVNEDILGSMEFACKVSGAKLIVLVGHQNCGAVKSAIDDVKLDNITILLSKIKPAVEMSQDFEGEKTSKHDEFVRYVSENNIRYNIEQIRMKSPILNEMEVKGEIKIVGMYYNLTDGKIEVVN
ncbi:MAG: carbonic anhydrase [bacterium]|nr:carbonic anhydrase [bacterium]